MASKQMVQQMRDGLREMDSRVRGMETARRLPGGSTPEAAQRVAIASIAAAVASIGRVVAEMADES